MTVEIIKRNGEDYVVIPYNFYQKLREDAEMLSDIQAYDWAKKNCQETFPADAIALEGENPVKIYREYRQFTIEELADKINLSPQSLQGIEQDINLATDENLKAIANILQIDVDMITD